MNWLMTSVAVFALFGVTAIGSEPVSIRPANDGHAPAGGSSSFFQRMAAVNAKRRQMARAAIELLALPQPRVAQFVLEQIDSNHKLTRLLNESEDLRQAREAAHRYWLNNPGKVATYKR